MQSNINSGEILHLEDFLTSKHGIKYKIIKESNQEKPQVGDIVSVHYTGCLLKGVNEVGQQFDSSLNRGEPLRFVLGFGQVIKGWDLSLADMKIGEERIVVLPANLAYGDQSVSIIPANSSLIFDIKLMGIE